MQEVISFVRGSGGLDFAERKMIEFQANAIEIISSFPESQAKKSLEHLVKHVVERKINIGKFPLVAILKTYRLNVFAYHSI